MTTPDITTERLPVEFTQEGRTLQQLKRNDKAAMYELRGHKGWLYGYEVVKIRVREPRVVFGRLQPRREVYPTPSDWGWAGFSYGAKHYEMAEERFRRLTLGLTGCISDP